MIDTEQLKKYIAGNSSQQEKEDIQLWLEADEKNRQEFLALRTLYDISLLNLEEETWDSFSKSPTKRIPYSIVGEILKIAAVILITFGCAYYFISPDNERIEIAMQTLHIPAGQRAELTLADGSKVWLNALTTFTFPTNFAENSREVFLDGEGFFEINHDANRRFTVQTNEYAVNVLGTEFNLSSYTKNNGFELALISGSVEIVSNKYNVSTILSPGNKIYKKGDQLITALIDNYDQFLWKQGIISFDNERIDDILDKLRLYYDIDINNKNHSINGRRYTGKFRTKDGIEHVLNVLKIPAGFNYTKDNEMNTIEIH